MAQTYSVRYEILLGGMSGVAGHCLTLPSPIVQAAAYADRLSVLRNLRSIRTQSHNAHCDIMPSAVLSLYKALPCGNLHQTINSSNLVFWNNCRSQKHS